jgi:hypothetical protein
MAMKKDLLLAALLIGLASLGIAFVAIWPLLMTNDEAEPIKPRTEVFAVSPKKAAPLIEKPAKPVAKKPVEPVEPVEVAEPIAMPMLKKAQLPEIVKEKIIQQKSEEKKQADAKVIILEPNIKLNDPDGEFVLKPVNAGKEVILLGVIKTLRLSGAGDRARIDATRLDAQEIIFTGNLNGGAKVLIGKARTLKIAGVNSGSLVDASANEAEHVVIAGDLNNSKVLLGKARTLKIAGVNSDSLLDGSQIDADEVAIAGNLNRSKVVLGKARKLTMGHVNDRSTLDGSKLNAQTIVVKGAVNGGSIVKLHAPGGSVQFAGPINDKGQIDVMAPGGKVVFNVRGAAIITGDAKLTLLSKELHLQGQIHGAKTHLQATLTKDGFLAFERLNSGVRLHYRNADPADPEPRVNRGQMDAKAELRKLDAK